MKTFSLARWFKGEDNPYSNRKMATVINQVESLFDALSDEQLKELFDLAISFREINRDNSYDERLKETKKLEGAASFGKVHDEALNRTLSEVVQNSMSFTDDDHSDLIRIVAREKYRRASEKEQGEFWEQFDEIFRQM